MVEQHAAIDISQMVFEIISDQLVKRTRRITGDLYAMMDAIESGSLVPVPECKILKVFRCRGASSRR